MIESLKPRSNDPYGVAGDFLGAPTTLVDPSQSGGSQVIVDPSGSRRALVVPAALATLEEPPHLHGSPFRRHCLRLHRNRGGWGVSTMTQHCHFSDLLAVEAEEQQALIGMLKRDATDSGPVRDRSVTHGLALQSLR